METIFNSVIDKILTLIKDIVRDARTREPAKPVLVSGSRAFLFPKSRHMKTYIRCAEHNSS